MRYFAEIINMPIAEKTGIDNIADTCKFLLHCEFYCVFRLHPYTHSAKVQYFSYIGTNINSPFPFRPEALQVQQPVPEYLQQGFLL